MSINNQLSEIENKRRYWRQLLDAGQLSQDSYNGLITASQEEERLLGRAYVINPRETKESDNAIPQRPPGTGG